VGFIEALRQKYFIIYGAADSDTNTIHLRKRNRHWVVTGLIRHLVAIPVDGVKVTKECEEVKLDDDRKFDFIQDEAIRRHDGLRARRPDHPFFELEDIEWTFWGPWADLAERH
jgi:hypothetical protein